MNGLKAKKPQNKQSPFANQSLIRKNKSTEWHIAYTISFIIFLFEEKKRGNWERPVGNCVQNYKVVLSGEINKPLPSLQLFGWSSVKGSVSISDKTLQKRRRKKPKTNRHNMILKL